VGKSALTQAFHSDGTHFPKNYTMVSYSVCQLNKLTCMYLLLAYFGVLTVSYDPSFSCFDLWPKHAAQLGHKFKGENKNL